MDTINNTEALTVFSRENVQMIAISAPDAYAICKTSHDKCLSAGQTLLNAVITNGGLNDTLDQEVAHFIEKSRRTAKKLNDTRSPITKLFDQFRTHFTTMENECDPTKKDTIPFKLQAYRNAYAAKKREEEQRRREEELRRQRADAARRQYATDVEEDYKASLNRTINDKLNKLQGLFAAVTLDNYETTYRQIQEFSDRLGEFTPPSTIRLPLDVAPDELRNIRIDVFNKSLPNFEQQFTFEVGNTRDELLAMLPSKRQELTRIAQANAEEAERLKAEMAAREAEEQRRASSARKAKEAADLAAKQMAAQQNEMDGLFNQAQLAQPNYQPKTQVKQRINVLSAEAIAPIFMMWWQEEGVKLPVDELTKIFKKQITYCEKVANDKDTPRFIDNPAVQYVEEVKAK